MRSLYFDPFSISAYEDLKIGEGTGRHAHKLNEPCHLTIVAAGSVLVTVFNEHNQATNWYECSAPSVIDYNDGSERHHQIKATMDGTTFYNVPRVGRATREGIAAELFGDQCQP